jgi:hypothetical protein
METIFRKVMCSDRLPKEENFYITDCGDTDFSDGYFRDMFGIREDREWWLEEVPINTIKKEAWNEGFNQGSVAMLDPNKHEPNFGLTKREYFAAMAMQGLLVNYNKHGHFGNSEYQPMVADIAVKCADELLKALEE